MTCVLSRDSVRTETADTQGSAGRRTDMPGSRNEQKYTRADCPRGMRAGQDMSGGNM